MSVFPTKKSQDFMAKYMYGSQYSNYISSLCVGVWVWWGGGGGARGDGGGGVTKLQVLIFIPYQSFQLVAETIPTELRPLFFKSTGFEGRDTIHRLQNFVN